MPLTPSFCKCHAQHNGMTFPNVSSILFTTLLEIDYQILLFSLVELVYPQYCDEVWSHWSQEGNNEWLKGLHHS